MANNVSWTLSCELAFYLTVPWLVPRLLRAKPGTVAVLFAAVVAAEFLGQRVLIALWQPHAAQMLLHGPAYRYLEFLTGAFIAALLRAGIPFGLRLRWCALAVGVMYAVVSTKQIWVASSDANSAIMLPFAALIAATATVSLRGRSVLDRPWLVNRGASSFALYLVHFPIVLAIGNIAVAHTAGTRLLLAAVALLLALLTAEAAHRWCEKPIERVLRNRIDHLTRTPEAAARSRARALLGDDGAGMTGSAVSSVRIDR